MNAIHSLVAYAVDLAEFGFIRAIQASWAAGLIAAVVLVVNLVCHRWLSAGQLGLLWAIVLLRLVIPVAPGSSWSLQRAAPFETFVVSPAPIDLQQTSAGSEVAPLRTPPEAARYRWLTSREAQKTTPDADLLRLADRALPVAWLLGACGFTAWTLLGYWRFVRDARQRPRCEDDRLVRVWTAVCHIAKLRKPPPIVIADATQQPALVGLFRPTLLLPADAEQWSDQHMEMIMLHEAAHLQRFDLPVNWMLAAVRAIHWWNPIFWLASRRFAALREQACDEFVIARVDATARRAYGELLVEMAGRTSTPWREVTLPAAMLGFSPSFFRSFAIRRRLVALHALPVSRSRWSIVMAATLLTLTAGSGLTDARSSAAARSQHAGSSQAPRTIGEWMAQPRLGPADDAAKTSSVPKKVDYREAALKRLHTGTAVRKTYDVSKALQRLAIDEPHVASATALGHLVSMVLQMPPRESYAPKTSSLTSFREASRGFSIDGTKLRLHAPAALHDELSATLAAWNDAGIGQISLRTRVVSSSHDVADELGIVWRHFGAAATESAAATELEGGEGGSVVRGSTAVERYLPIAMTNLTSDQTIAFNEAVQGGRGVNLRQQMSVTVFNGQTARMVDCVQRPFVVGVEYVGGAPGFQGACQPKIEVVEEGLRIRFRATQSADLKQIAFRSRMQTSVVEEVFTSSMKYHGEAVTIQNPQVSRRDVEFDANVADGESLLVGCLPTDGQEGFFYVLFTPEALSGKTFSKAE